MLDDMTPSERLLLLRFVCAFAWSDLEVLDAERSFVRRLVDELDLTPAERVEVAGWLDSGVPPEVVDPNLIPRAHRDTFLSMARQVVAADGRTDPDESEDLRLLQQLLSQ
jgi:uncharacterized tellurite resistance protein B-like protein